MFGLSNKFGGGQAARPMPRPGTPAAAAQPTARRGLFGDMSPQTRHDITMSLLGNMQGYLGANASPTAHLLAPIATALLGSRAESGLATAKQQARDEAIRTLGANGLGTMPADRMSALLGVAGSDMVDDPIRSLARSMITTGMRPVATGGGGGGGRARSGGGRGGSRGRGGSPADPYSSISASMAGNLLDASETIREGVDSLMLDGMSAEEAEAALRSQPGYGPAFSLLDRYGGGAGPAAPVVPVVPEVTIPSVDPAPAGGRSWGQWWNGEDPGAPPAPKPSAPPPPPGTVPY